MIEYICPKCGAKMDALCLTSLPPVYRYKCTKCSYEYEAGSNIAQTTIAPKLMMTLTTHDEFTVHY